MAGDNETISAVRKGKGRARILATVVALGSLLIALVGASSAATGSRPNKLTTVATVRSYYASLAIGRDGLPVISYDGDGQLKVLHCGNRACSLGNTIATVDKRRGVAYWSSMTIGADGLPLISYGGNPGPARV